MQKNKNHILQTFIIPVCRFNHKTGNIDFQYGTAFFTSCSGVFITAKHVYNDMVKARQQDSAHSYGLCVKGASNENLFVPIGEIEFAPNSVDIAVGKVHFKTASPIKLTRKPLNFLQDVFAIGYPVTAAENAGHPMSACWMDLRAHKGYINREVSTKAMELVGRKDSVELSFWLEAGMSGAPLFVDSNFLVSGICLATKTVEMYEHRIDENKKVLRHIEYGVAQMTSSLVGWKPSILSPIECEALFQG